MPIEKIFTFNNNYEFKTGSKDIRITFSFRRFA